MNTNKTIEELIEGYNLGTLSPSELSYMEEQLALDATLSEAVLLDREINEVIAGNAEATLRQQLATDLYKIESNRKNKIKWAVAGGILLVALTGYFYFNAESGQPEKHKEVPQPTSFLGKSTTPNKEVGQKDLSIDVQLAISEKTPPVNAEEKKPAVTTVNEAVPTPVIDVVVEKTSDTQTEQVKVEIKEKTPIDPSRELPCDVSFNVSSTETCVNDNSGTIKIASSSIRGAEQPVTFNLNTGEENSFGEFTNLAAGHYLVSITDKRGCVLAKEIELKSKNCLLQTSSFSPAYGESTTLLQSPRSAGILQIVNREGKTIHTAHFQAGEPISWNGSTLSGVVPEGGLYLGIVKFENGVTEKVEITILR